MRDETPDIGVEIRGIETRGSGEEVTDVLVVAVPTPNPQSRSRDSYVDDEMLVGEIPITNTELSEMDVKTRLNAEFVTVLEEYVRAYYPIEDIWIGTLTWDAATDEWTYDRRELETYSFDPQNVQVDDEESVLWRRVNDESVTR